MLAPRNKYIMCSVSMQASCFLDIILTSFFCNFYCIMFINFITAACGKCLFNHLVKLRSKFSFVYVIFIGTTNCNMRNLIFSKVSVNRFKDNASCLKLQIDIPTANIFSKYTLKRFENCIELLIK